MEEKLQYDVELALKLLMANDAREHFTVQFGGFDNFAEVWQHVGSNRKQFDQLAATAEEARLAFLKVDDKRAVIEYMRLNGQEASAVRIAQIAGIKFSSKTEVVTRGARSIMTLRPDQFPSCWQTTTFSDGRRTAELKVRRWGTKLFHVAWKSGDLVMTDKGQISNPIYASLNVVGFTGSVEQLLHERVFFKE